MNITWYWGTDSSCPNLIGTNSSVGNGTYTMDNDANFSLNSQTYYWKLIINDGHGGWTNATYHFTTIGANKEIVSKGQSAYSLEMNPSGTTLYGYAKGTSVQTSIDTSWHYVVLTYDGSQLKLYKDGELKTNTSLTGAIPTNVNNLTIGEYLTGTLDEIRISSSARSAAWINTTYKNTNSPTTFATFGDQMGILSTWTYRKSITINASMVDADLTNFPVLISTTDTDLKNNALSNGYDILFTNSSVDWTSGSTAQKLDHEIEKYDSTTGELVAWVRIPLLSSTSNTVIYMYYGNSLCTANRQNPTGVWDSYYTGVWHFAETSGDYVDSTPFKNNATTISVKSRIATGKVGYCPEFDDGDGSNDEIIVPNATSLNFDNNQDFTLEGWLKMPTPTNPPESGIMVKGYHTTTPEASYYAWTTADPGEHDMYLKASGQTRNDFSATTTNIDDDVWHYVTFTRDADGNCILWTDGKLEAQEATTSSGAINPTQDLYFGRQYNQYYKGLYDEFRISKGVARSSSWINTSYNTMNDSGNFTMFGPQKTRNVAPTQSSPSPSDGATGTNLTPTLSITVNDTNVDSLNVYFYTNVTGSWGLIGSNLSVYNGTYSQTNDSMSSYSTTYWWSVNVTDGIGWTNATYNFTTQSEPLPQTETLRPNATGDETNIWIQIPSSGAHWDKVDEAVADNDTTHVRTSGEDTYTRDLYNLPAHAGSGTINFIKVYARCKTDFFVQQDSLKIAIKTGGTANESGVTTVTTSYVNYSNQWTINPQTVVAWTWDDIDALQIGISLRRAGYDGEIGASNTYCTQVYVEVNYTSSPFLYTYKNNQYTKLSDFIPGATSKEKEYTHTIDITDKADVINGKVWLKITEELDETTYLDQVYLKVDDDKIVELDKIKTPLPILKSLANQFFLSYTNKKLLRYSDDCYLILEKGDKFYLDFTIPSKFLDYDKLEFVAEGYYIDQSLSHLKVNNHIHNHK